MLLSVMISISIIFFLKFFTVSIFLENSKIVCPSSTPNYHVIDQNAQILFFVLKGCAQEVQCMMTVLKLFLNNNWNRAHSEHSESNG